MGRGPWELRDEDLLSLVIAGEDAGWGFARVGICYLYFLRGILLDGDFSSLVKAVGGAGRGFVILSNCGGRCGMGICDLYLLRGNIRDMD